jgi:hypothetical protein
MLLWLIFGSYFGYTSTMGWRWYFPNLLLFILLLILGWKVFGRPIKG